MTDHAQTAQPDLNQNYLDFDPLTDPGLINYSPIVISKTGEWMLSEIDLAFIYEGVGVLGCGKLCQMYCYHGN